MLPKMSGLDVCKRVRTELRLNTPVMILTARADTMDKVLGLEIGADDYLTKPFEVREFVARVRALLRRATPENSDLFKAGPFELNESSKKIFLDKKEIQLTPNEFKLLSTLIKKPGTTFDRGDLIKLIQGPGVAVVDRTIDTTVLGLRKKLGAAADRVETVRGFGYRLRGT
jgi:DNA-binding response OmpR family regulator